MDVRAAPDCVDPTSGRHRHDNRMDQVGGVIPEDVRTENAIGPALDDDLRQATLLSPRTRFAS